MAGVTRIYVYRFKPPGDALVLATAMHAAGERLAKFNKNVIKVDTQADGEDMLLRVWFTGHDQWQIKKKIIYPVASILTKAGLKIKDVKLDAVERPPDTRSTRPRASDGRSTPLPEDEMIDHSDMGLVT